ncbi:MAG TPA: hypothetical protein PLR44_07510 [Thermomicrobiales bacterium]|nr:lipopolysaccharide biosynthesis protein [Chloroflexota bacterium]HBY47691.1 lipopolysaccharide biosynthesis protein [Chloroflexota bacterium]HCG28413.1 lipopolysaccharide biosynthesis protein [Chloroflexota bacterium]HQZ89884.1 hypothetical protein [Thermomicrobiales bacterium]
MMRPEEIALAVARRAWIIVLAALAGGLVAYVMTSQQPKTYTASARLMAVAQPPDYWIDLYAKNRLASYRDLISTWTFINQALTDMGTDIPVEVAAPKVAVSHNPDANTVQVIVTDTDPQRAATIVNALADEFVRQTDAQNAEILSRPRPSSQQAPAVVTILKLDTPSAPTTPSGPRVKVNAVAGAVAGGLAGACVVFLLIYRDDTLKGRADLERYLGLPVLASVAQDGGR